MTESEKTTNQRNTFSESEIKLQNYPNPFNPTTIITYELPENTHVKLKVYNSVGEQVAELIDMDKQKGLYTVEFDGSNLSSGIYYYSLLTGKFTKTGKMILTK